MKERLFAGRMLLLATTLALGVLFNLPEVCAEIPPIVRHCQRLSWIVLDCQGLSGIVTHSRPHCHPQSRLHCRLRFEPIVQSRRRWGWCRGWKGRILAQDGKASRSILVNHNLLKFFCRCGIKDGNISMTTTQGKLRSTSGFE